MPRMSMNDVIERVSREATPGALCAQDMADEALREAIRSLLAGMRDPVSAAPNPASPDRDAAAQEMIGRMAVVTATGLRSAKNTIECVRTLMRVGREHSRLDASRKLAALIALDVSEELSRVLDETRGGA